MMMMMRSVKGTLGGSVWPRRTDYEIVPEIHPARPTFVLRLNGDRLLHHIWLFNGQIWVQRGETPCGRFSWNAMG